MTSATIDANTKINLSQLVVLLGLGVGGIWKVSNITNSIDVGNARLSNIEAKVSELNESMKGVVPFPVFEQWKAAQASRDGAQDSRMDRFDRLIDGEKAAGGK